MDPRKILGVSPDASMEEIQRAYRAKVKKHHPDMGGDVWAFQQVNEAYQKLAGKVENSNRPMFDNETETKSPVSSKSHRASTKATDKPNKKPSATRTQRKASFSLREQLFVNRELPLQNETTFFIFINVMDIFMTYILLQFGAMEANPIANYFMFKWGFRGMTAFKLGNVLVVCLIAQFIAAKKPQTGRALLNVGSLIVGIVVIYSAALFFRKFSIGP